MRPDIELPHESDFECPDDAVALIEEYHAGLHSITVTRKEGRSKFRPIGKIICQQGGDKNSRPEATPHELGEMVMCWIQHEIDESDDPGTYRMQLIGPPGKGTFRRAKHISLENDDGIARTKDMLSEGDMIEQQSHYIGTLHEQLSGMVDLVLASYKVVVGENREMMKILSEATRKHGEIEAQRLTHQLNLKIHEDDVKFQEMEGERSLQKFREGLNVFKETNAAEELVRAVAKKIQGVKDGQGRSAKKEEESESASIPDTEKTASPSQSPFHRPGIAQGELIRSEDEPVESEPKGKKKASKKKTTKKKAAKKVTKKGKLTKKKSSKKAKAEEQAEDIEIPPEVEEMVMTRPLVTAAEALKMSIDQKSQWSKIHKILSDEQSEILDEIFAAPTDDEVIEHATRLYKAKGMMKLIDLRKELDEQQQAFIMMILSKVDQED